MSHASLGVSGDLLDYLRRVGVRESTALRALREETAEHPRAMMQISPEQGAFMALLVKLIGAKRTLEVGVFTGYSSLAVAEAMGPDGRIVALDISEEFTAIARRHWESAGVAGQIDLRIGPAADSLANMVDQDAASFDFAFIDADKTGYQTYIDHTHTLLRPGGLMAVDNVLWGGSVIDPSNETEDTVAIRAVNEALKQDERFDICLAPVGDGIFLARKRP